MFTALHVTRDLASDKLAVNKSQNGWVLLLPPPSATGTGFPSAWAWDRLAAPERKLRTEHLCPGAGTPASPGSGFPPLVTSLWARFCSNALNHLPAFISSSHSHPHLTLLKPGIRPCHSSANAQRRASNATHVGCRAPQQLPPYAHIKETENVSTFGHSHSSTIPNSPKCEPSAPTDTQTTG